MSPLLESLNKTLFVSFFRLLPWAKEACFSNLLVYEIMTSTLDILDIVLESG